jgi:DNA invertase Pin-like site-specific DNA recombinase
VQRAGAYEKPDHGSIAKTQRRQGRIILIQFIPKSIANRMVFVICLRPRNTNAEDTAHGKARGAVDAMLKDASRRKFDVAMAWAIDRLGRSLIDLLNLIQHLEACGVDLYLDQQAIDTTTPMGKLVFQVTGAFAEFERSMIRQRVKLGLKRAIAKGVKLGRPKVDSAIERKIERQLAKGTGILKTAKLLGIGTSTVQRIKAATAPFCDGGQATAPQIT